MTLSAKESRPARPVKVEEVSPDDFDFGDPEMVSVEIAPGKFLDLKEPSASDLIEIEKLSRRKDASGKETISEMEQILATVCILHHPAPDGIKLNMRQAKRLRASQIRLLSDAMARLMGMRGEDEEENKSVGEEEL